MTTDNKQYVLTELPWAEWLARRYGEEFTLKMLSEISDAVLSKLRGLGEPLYVDEGHLREVMNGNDMPVYASSVPSRGMVSLFAAPQASAEVRNAALEEAANFCDDRADVYAHGEFHGRIWCRAAEAIRALKSAPAAEQHPDDSAVDRCAAAMKAKLAKKRAEGRGGWEDKSQCTAEFLSSLLREHVVKGDPGDVANLAMMLHQRGDRVAPKNSGNDHYIEGVNVERLQRACRALGLRTEGSLEAFISPDTHADHINRLTTATINYVLADRQRRGGDVKHIADDTRVGILADSSYLEGVKVGYSLGLFTDQAKYQQIVGSISRQIREARAELDDDDSAKGAGDVELPHPLGIVDPDATAPRVYAVQDLANYARAAVLADREKQAKSVAALREALKFYADQDHFIVDDDDAWDTVSGEPQNIFFDEAGTAMVEDGSIARAALSAQEGK